MLPGDDRVAADTASTALDTQPQFWDGDGKLGAEVARSVGIDGWVAWDIYLFYPPGARWDDHLPAPSVAIAQAKGVVIATKGALPAVDSDALPARWRDRADVVGEQTDLEQLLARAAHRAAAMTTTSPSPPTTR
jgi:hypothetical protein